MLQCKKSTYGGEDRLPALLAHHRCQLLPELLKGRILVVIEAT
jgi:hypothetical protein